MSRKKSDKGEPRPSPDDRQPQDQPAGQADAGAGGEPEQVADQVEQDLQEALNIVQKERDELEDRIRRIAADYQNYVRRSEQNAVSACEQQLFDVARGLVTVLDHFDRALDQDPAKASTEDLLAGVQMVREELLRSLGRFGIERMDAKVGEPFDPNRHEALMRQASDDVEADHVTAQFQPGYTLKNKTIRPAQVSVAE